MRRKRGVRKRKNNTHELQARGNGGKRPERVAMCGKYYRIILLNEQKPEITALKRFLCNGNKANLNSIWAIKMGKVLSI